jgi:hypothetical protein
VQQTIDAARHASEANPKVSSLAGAPLAYFPKGCYPINKKIQITGNNYYVEGAGGLTTAFDWVADDLIDNDNRANHTDGVFEVAPGCQNVSVSSMQFGAGGNSSMAKILVRGTAGQGGDMNATRLIFHGLYFGGYGDAKRPPHSWSGLRILDLGPNDIVDVPYINGDIEIFSNAGTVLTGFHLTGVSVVSAPLDGPDSSSSKKNANAAAESDDSLFVGELMTFKCCDQDFSEYIYGSNGLTYVVGDYYQESGPQNVYATSDRLVFEPPAPADMHSGRIHARYRTRSADDDTVKPSTVVLSTTKGFSFNDTNSEIHNFDGLFAMIGGHISTQSAHNPSGKQTICQIVEETTTGTYLGLRPRRYNMIESVLQNLKNIDHASVPIIDQSNPDWNTEQMLCENRHEQGQSGARWDAGDGTAGALRRQPRYDATMALLNDWRVVTPKALQNALDLPRLTRFDTFSSKRYCFDGTDAKQTVVASVTTDGFKNLTVLPSQFSEDYSDDAIAEAMDALRR